jgi:hypothetical protein
VLIGGPQRAVSHSHDWIYLAQITTMWTQLVSVSLVLGVRCNNSPCLPGLTPLPVETPPIQPHPLGIRTKVYGAPSTHSPHIE